MASLDKEKLEEMRGKIRKNPGYVIRETKAGGLEALSVLSLRDSIENLPREHHIPALHALVANIGSPDILDDADELSDVFYIHLRTQLATLDGIGWISELIKDGVYEEEMTKALLSHWRIIYKCLTMLWKKEVQKIWDTFEVAEGSHTRLAIYARVMDTYLMPRDLARIVLRDTTVLDFVFGMWLWESELPTKYLDFWVSAALNNCFQFEGRPGDVFLARVLELAGDARRVARYATTRLRVAFKYIDKHEEFPIIHDLDVACTLCFNDAMRSEILRLNGEPIVTKITLKVSEMVKDLAVVQRNEELMNVGCVIYVCFRFLNMTMDTEGGHVWICQALRAGLLQIIVNICPRLTTLNLPMDPSLSTFIKHTLGDLLPRFLMFKSVINAVILATKQLKLDEITEHVYSDREIPKFWDFYGRVVLDRLVTKLVFNHLSSGVYGSFCDNCAKLLPKGTALMCSGCRIAHYCRRDCQKKAWREGRHRERCRSLGRKNRASLFKFKHQRFIHMLAVMTIQRHSPAIRKHLLRRHDPGYVFPGVAGIIVNFEKAPAKIDVQSGAPVDGAILPLRITYRIQSRTYTINTVFNKDIPFHQQYLTQKNSASQLACVDGDEHRASGIELIESIVDGVGPRTCGFWVRNAEGKIVHIHERVLELLSLKVSTLPRSHRAVVLHSTPA